MKGWMQGDGPQSDIILSSRIRLARNIADIPFPSGLDDERADAVISKVRNSILKSESALKFKDYIMQELPPIERQYLVERHLVSPGLLKSSAKGAALISSDGIVSIMVNEEDHIRIQTILSGLQIKKSWEMASSIDDILEQSIEYAYSENWGYLTSCPTNVGTGMRASVMMHLPALNITGNMSKILQAVAHIGLTIRGLYGEGTEIVGNIFQVSNQITLGRAEEEIVENLTAVARQIIDKEKEARQILLESNRIQIEDKIWRSWGIMKNARVMNSLECMKLLSDMRLGVDLNIIKDTPVQLLNEIMIETQTASIQRSSGRELNPGERDVIRAEIVRNKLNS
ncbi:MAG TPA: protein arginine kinase [Bacillota bacterium]|nr:protein arginine kinase [Bacillota bacterium]HOR86624.1 protein arginine kinase [Bacillota bacterium]HPL54102.1 protein arginine kinase [Bacillota bacterium]